MKDMAVVSLVPYDAEWHKKFIEEKKKILNKLPGEEIRIEHIGSTSIKGMEARPIVDLMIGLQYFNRTIKKVKNVLKIIGYNEIPNLFDLGERFIFIKEDDKGKRIFTALIVRVNGRLWKKNLERRKLLSTSEEVRRNYIEFKKESIAKYRDDWEKYYRAKEKYFSKN